MAEINPLHIQMDVSEELQKLLQEVKDGLSEERIRQIVREELAAWEKQQSQMLRRFGLPMETKSAPVSRVDINLIGEG